MRKKMILALIASCLSVAFLTATPGINSRSYFDGKFYADTTVTGNVIDSSGFALAGATVRQKGTSRGVSTDNNGKFSIEVTGPRPILEITLIGYEEQNIVIGDRSTISIILSRSSSVLDNVVVVGYGTQKKVNLTGAVASVNVDEKISSRTLTNVSSALSGLVPGLAVQQSSGMAGASGASLLIRGLGTVNNASPLVVVDGMPDVDINRIDINDIENISVLKDASSASIYGSRAANGVILITTKTGKGVKKARINYTGNYALSDPTNFYNTLKDYPRALTLHQRAARAGRTAPAYYDGTIEQWMAMGLIDPYTYPSEDQLDWVTQTGKVQSHNLAVSGSGENTNLYLSIGVLDEKGFLVNNDASRYNFRFNMDYEVRKNIHVGMRTDGQWSKMTYGMPNGFVDYNVATNNILTVAITGLLPYHYESKQYGGVSAYGEAPNATNMYAEYMARHNQRDRQEFNANIYGEWEPLKGLRARIDYGLRYYNQFIKGYNDPGTNLINFQTGNSTFELFPASEGISNSSVQGYKTLLQARLNYDRELFGDHKLALLAGVTEEYWLDRDFSAGRNDRLHPNLVEINGALVTTQRTSGSSSAEGLRSVFGRLNYSIKERYLFEFSARGDGSSKFLPGHQFGFFPSGSVGWRFSEENFFERFKNALSSAKLRASYGSLGNNSGVGRYEQQETFRSTPYILNGNNLVRGFSAYKNINRDFSWEKTTVANIGLDLGFFNNKLIAEIDVYDRLTTGMIRPSTLSIFLSGYTAPRANIGDLRNNGIELNLTWKSKINSFRYGVNFNYSYNIDRLEKYNERRNPSKIFLDMPYFFEYHMLTTGVAQTWDDIYNAPYQNNNNIAPGDILYEDLDGDGQITGADKKAFPEINEQRPTSNYGMNIFGEWRGFDASILLQAATGRKDYWIEDLANVHIGLQRYAFQELHWYDTWTLENRNADLPRITSGNTPRNRDESDFWLQSMNYLRLKNVQLGYNLPPRWLKLAGVQRFRIYASAENIATFTKWKGVDPEKSTVGNGFASFNDDPFPILKTYAFGINIGL